MSECIIPDFYSHSMPIARKRHKCIECFAPIEIGEEHFKGTGKWEGEFYTHRQHIACMEACMMVRDHFNDHECLAFGELMTWYAECFDRWEFKDNPNVVEFRRLMAKILRRKRKSKGGV